MITGEQLGLDGMPTRLFSCTPTRLTTWSDCPRRYRMTYVDRPQPPKGPPWAHNSVGASVHTALAAWWRRSLERRTPEAARRLLTAGWLKDGFRDDAQCDRHRAAACDMVESYVAELDPADEPLGVERTVSTRTDVLALSGRVDRLDSRVSQTSEVEQLVIVDYKTGPRVLDVADARSSLALAMYAIAAAATFRRPCHRVELHHLPTGRAIGWDHPDQDLAEHLSRAETIASEAQAAEEDGADRRFPPRPGSQCGWCDFIRVCPEGRAAAEIRAPWDGLADA